MVPLSIYRYLIDSVTEVLAVVKRKRIYWGLREPLAQMCQSGLRFPSCLYFLHRLRPEDAARIRLYRRIEIFEKFLPVLAGELLLPRQNGSGNWIRTSVSGFQVQRPRPLDDAAMRVG